MLPALDHPWDISPKEAIRLQHQLRKRVALVDDLSQVQTIAGTDVSYNAKLKVARAVVALLSYPDLSLKSYTSAISSTSFPYVPGLLSFREIPPLMECFRKLKAQPDLILCDGHGFAHPRRFGLASHLGILYDLPSIGVAKRILVGAHEDVPQTHGAWKPLIHEGEIVGAALRSRSRTRVIYVSIGHRVSLETSIQWVMQCTTHYRLPETTRWAHRLSKSEKLD
jgi:deoxyribonuclease V